MIRLGVIGKWLLRVLSDENVLEKWWLDDIVNVPDALNRSLWVASIL